MKIKIEIKADAKFLDLDMLGKDELVGFVGASRDYGKFSLSKYNRKINPKHAENLLKKLEKGEEVRIEPIVVDRNFNIVDGQHRFWALSRLGMAVPYIVDNSISIKDTVAINGNQKALNFMDYMDMNVATGNKNYEALYSEIKKYKKAATPGYIGMLFMGFGIQNGNISKKIEMGKFKFDYKNKLKIESFLDFLEKKRESLHLRGRIRQGVEEAIYPFFFNSHVDKDRLFRILTSELIQDLDRSPLSKKKIADAYNYKLRSHALQYSFYSKENKDHFEFL